MNTSAAVKTDSINPIIASVTANTGIPCSSSYLNSMFHVHMSRLTVCFSLIVWLLPCDTRLSTIIARCGSCFGVYTVFRCHGFLVGSTVWVMFALLRSLHVCYAKVLSGMLFTD